MNLRALKTSGLVALAMASAFAPLQALAHSGHPTDQGLGAGLSAGMIHPLTGLDHLLAMIAVGFWAAQYRSGKVALWLPFGFVAGMLLGAATGFAGLWLPALETVIALSVVSIGLALTFKDRVPLAAAALTCAVAGLFHGYAHAQEASGSMLPFVVGFFMTTVVLHALGGFAGFRLSRLGFASPLLGGAMAVAGFAMLTG